MNKNLILCFSVLILTVFLVCSAAVAEDLSDYEITGFYYDSNTGTILTKYEDFSPSEVIAFLNGDAVDTLEPSIGGGGSSNNDVTPVVISGDGLPISISGPTSGSGTGNSANAPGQNTYSTPGNSTNAPGQSNDSTPGNSGNSPGQNKKK